MPEEPEVKANSVVAGGVFTIAPEIPVIWPCGNPVTLSSAAAPANGVGKIIYGEWKSADVADDVVSDPGCQGLASAASVSFVVPAEVPAGSYQMCLSAPEDPAGCAVVDVQTASAANPLPQRSQATLGDKARPDTEYFGVRWNDLQVKIVERFDDTGNVTEILSDDELDALVTPATMADGTMLRLDGEQPAGRCPNQQLNRVDGASVEPLNTQLAQARSFGISPNGLVVAARDVCPDGTRWGDPGTYWELVSLDPNAPTQAPTTLLTRVSDPQTIQFDDGTMRIAMGEMYIEGFSPDGRFVAVRDQFGTESWRYHLIDLSSPDGIVSTYSGCPLAGDIIGQPRFLDGGIVVLARLCATRLVDPPSPFDVFGDGDIQIDAIDLNAPDQGNSLVWSTSLAGLEADSYGRTVALSARLAVDGTIWAIVTGNGGVEIPSETYVFHGTEATEITRVDSSFFFTVADFAPNG